MKLPLKFFSPLIGLLFASLPAQAQPNHTTLDRQHVDLRLLYTPGASNEMVFVARDEDNKINYRSNEVVLLAEAASQYILDSDFPPFGNAGESIWILPQSQEPGLLYQGFSLEGIPQGVFSGPLTIQLKALDGPGHFFVWQAGAFGEFNIKMNTRDGISTSDSNSPIIGAHEHYNWGFTTSGWYYVTFQVSGRRTGETTNISTPDTTFVFHVLPMKPFERWQEDHWLFTMPRSIVAPAADPDGDGVVNLLEYAFGNDPNIALRTNLPTCVLTSVAGTNFGALRYWRNTNATDLTFAPVAASSVTNSAWSNLTNVVSTSTNGAIQTITIRDEQSTSSAPQRFYQLRVNLNP